MEVTALLRWAPMRPGLTNALVLVGGISGCFSDAPTVDISEADTGTTANVGSTQDASADTASADTTSPDSTDSTTAGITTDEADTTTTGRPACDKTCFTGDCNAEGQCLRTVFVTRASYPVSAFGGIEGADTLCSDEAAEAGLDGHFRAFLTSRQDLSSAWIHVGASIDDDAVFVLADEARSVVATTPMQLRLDLDPTVELERAIDTDAHGMAVVGTATACEQPERVWTGLAIGGDFVVAGGDCGGWAKLNGTAGAGRFDFLHRGWAGASNCACLPEGAEASPTAHLYCFEASAP